MERVPFVVHLLYWIVPLVSVINAIIMAKTIPEESDI